MDIVFEGGLQPIADAHSNMVCTSHCTCQATKMPGELTVCRIVFSKAVRRTAELDGCISDMHLGSHSFINR